MNVKDCEQIRLAQFAFVHIKLGCTIARSKLHTIYNFRRGGPPLDPRRAILRLRSVLSSGNVEITCSLRHEHSNYQQDLILSIYKHKPLTKDYSP